MPGCPAPGPTTAASASLYSQVFVHKQVLDLADSAGNISELALLVVVASCQSHWEQQLCFMCATTQALEIAHTKHACDFLMTLTRMITPDKLGN